MVDCFRVHRANETHVINALRQIWKKLRDPHPAFAMLLERELGRGDRKTTLTTGHRRKTLAVSDALRQILVKPIVHFWFVVKEVYLWGTADHVEIDDALCLWSKMKLGKRAWNTFILWRSDGCGCGCNSQLSKCRETEYIFATRKELSTCFKSNPFLIQWMKLTVVFSHLTKTSSRFRIWLHNIVQAARSPAGRSFGAGVSPYAISFSASALWLL